MHLLDFGPKFGPGRSFCSIWRWAVGPILLDFSLQPLTTFENTFLRVHLIDPFSVKGRGAVPQNLLIFSVKWGEGALQGWQYIGTIGRFVQLCPYPTPIFLNCPNLAYSNWVGTFLFQFYHSGGVSFLLLDDRSNFASD